MVYLTSGLWQNSVMENFLPEPVIRVLLILGWLDVDATFLHIFNIILLTILHLWSQIV